MIGMILISTMGIILNIPRLVRYMTLSEENRTRTNSCVRLKIPWTWLQNLESLGVRQGMYKHLIGRNCKTVSSHLKLGLRRSWWRILQALYLLLDILAQNPWGGMF